MAPKRRRRWVRLFQVACGLAVGLTAAEVVFRARDHGAFPHLNLYVPDGKLAVRLRPGARERISFSGNPVTEVRINSAGYRGDELPPPAPREILVVGDSQVFGLGVEETETFSAELARLTKRQVVNAGVPTYGPDEYNAVAAELLAQRHSKTVVWVVNLANDLFEAAHPNVERHAVWDGWAVRRETAPARVTSFPGRAWLYGQSHAMFALRGWWFGRAEAAEDRGTVSEGTWRDLIGAGKQTAAAREAARARAEEERKARVAEIARTRQELDALQRPMSQLMASAQIADEEVGIGTIRAATANPGDIVRINYGEGSRPVAATAVDILAAAQARNKLEAALKERHDRAGLATLSQFDTLSTKIKELKAAQTRVLRVHSPLYAHLERAKALCDANGAELVVVVLPVDVQVSAEEWKKYGAPPLDLAPTRVLVEDVVTSTEELGARAVDAWPALAAAEPGAFLKGDIHLTPKGHRALAAALARQLDAAEKAPPRDLLAELLLPAGRSPVPSPAEWERAGKLEDQLDQLYDLRRSGCRAQKLREWMKVSCKAPSSVTVTAPGRSDAMALTTPDGATLVAALLEGDKLQARFGFANGTRVFGSSWALGEDAPELIITALVPPKAGAPSIGAAPSDEERALCDCHKQTTGASDCSALYGAADADCRRAYSADCRRLLACARGDVSSPPVCAPGHKLTGAAPRCR